MAQIIPPITSLPVDSLAAPSAEDIQDRLPSICVDYLSHDWSEEDVWASWRSMTRHKHEIANGVRLENASWRTWQKQRNNLKTISPETLNWLKDSDVTWLYGPLHTANVEPVRPLKVASTDERLGIDRPNPQRAPSKPILKHRTLSEMLTIPNPSSPILEATREEDDVSSDEGGPKRPALIQTKSDTNIANSRTSAVRYRSPPRMPISGKVSPGESQHAASPGEKEPGQKKHISFNTFVEQCIAVSEADLPVQPDSDDDMLEIRSNSSRSSRGSRPSLSRHSSASSVGSEHLTIAKIAPTMLKTNGTFVSSDAPQMVYAPPPEYRSPREAEAQSGGDFPSPQMQQRDRWIGDDEDEYGSVGYDYFGGPNLADNQPSHVGASYGRAPTVQTAPPQAKWRQPSSVGSSEPSSVSSSSSASLNTIVSPPVPSRGILKVRPPGSTPPEPASPPQSSYFNYNPSAATGIGGMRSSYESASVLDQQHGDVVSPATQERGRSAQRQAGSIHDRSASRGTSTSSASISPGSTRSPPIDIVRGRSDSAPKSPPIPYQAHVQAAAPVPTNPPKAEGMDVDEPYQPERNNTPTPHSSPQITFRPLQDTSPSSLPHASSRPTNIRSSSNTSSQSNTSAASLLSPELPKADPPIALSPEHSKSIGSLNRNINRGGKPTIAHVGANTRTTISQPPAEYDVEEEGDGSSIMGRAANIANTAREMIGSFWYGQEGGQGQGRGISQGATIGGGVGGQQQSGGAALTRTWSGGRHKRGASFG